MGLNEYPTRGIFYSRACMSRRTIKSAMQLKGFREICRAEWSRWVAWSSWSLINDDDIRNFKISWRNCVSAHSIMVYISQLKRKYWHLLWLLIENVFIGKPLQFDKKWCHMPSCIYNTISVIWEMCVVSSMLLFSLTGLLETSTFNLVFRFVSIHRL